ncbi:MAG: hypothetical protein FWF87_02825 [Synergistaceae bacterium]|nr:hypothetical protein [Synergistaceae bacterium]
MNVSRTKIFYIIGIIVVAGFLGASLCILSAHAGSDAAAEKNDAVGDAALGVPLVEDAALGVPSVVTETYGAVDKNLFIGSLPRELKSIRMRPKYIESEIVGIEVKWIANDNVLFKYGIQIGDVIKSICGVPINGMPVENPGDLIFFIMHLIGDGSPFTAQIIRGDSSIQLIYGESLYMAQNETEKFRLRQKFESNGYQPKWVEIFRLRDDSVLVKLGLQKNDIIKSFNGFSIIYAEDLINSVNRAMRKSSFDIEIVRNNEPLAVIYIVK